MECQQQKPGTAGTSSSVINSIVYQSVISRKSSTIPSAKFHGTVAVVLGILQICLGLAVFVLDILNIVWAEQRIRLQLNLWCTLFVITGTFGVLSGRRQNQRRIEIYMLMNIVSAALALHLVVAQGLSSYCSVDDNVWNCTGFSVAPRSSLWVILPALKSALAGVECIVAVISAVLCYISVGCFHEHASTPCTHVTESGDGPSYAKLSMEPGRLPTPVS